MYYSAIGIISIIIHLIINHEYFRNKEDKTEVNKVFKLYIWVALIYYITDSIWGVLYELHIPTILYIDTLLYYLTMAFSVVLLCRYVTTYLRLSTGFGRFILYFGHVFAVLEILALIVNHFVHIFFWIDEDTVYHAYTMRYVALYMQVFLCVLLAIQTGSVMKKAIGEMKKRYFTIFLFCVEMTAAIIAQIAYPLLPLYSVGMVIGIIIIHTFVKESEKENQYRILSSIAEVNYSMHVIDLVHDTVDEISAKNEVDNIIDNRRTGAAVIMKQVMTAVTQDDYLERALEFTDLTTIADRIGDKKTIATQLVGKNIGWFLATFIVIEKDADGKATKVAYTTREIDEEKRQEERLIYKSQTDELTGLYNRRAYEDDMLAYPAIPPEADFVYAAIDINGLKVVNDELGHAAGDELIKGAADCLKRTLGNYGKVYRTGGDEFVAIFFADEEHLEYIISDLDSVMMEWSGQLVSSLSLSVGYVTKRGLENETIINIAKLADDRMYKAKADYYSRKGIDRRGQAAAHKALCDLYTKILKINLTEDTYSIVNMDISEQTREKGFTDTISGWLSGFGKSGQVHSDDLSMYLEKTDVNYLKEYFKSGKSSISIMYRRKYDDGFKQVAMEMIKADDYKESNQNLFLYVKNIDI